MLLPKNDGAVKFFREQGYGNTYNDGLVAFLRDYLQVDGKSLNDLLKLYEDLVGESILTPFTPADLFTDSQEGAWWDVQDLSTMFSDDAATTQAVVDGVVAVHQDKSGNGHHRTQTNNSLRPILRQRADGVYYLDYSSGKILSVPSSTASFNYLHNGDGGTFIAFIEWLQGSSASRYMQNAPSTSSVGFQITNSSTTQNAIISIARGVSSVLASSTSLIRFALSSPAKLLGWSYKNDGGADDLKTWSDWPRDFWTDTTDNAPSSANASNDLAIVNSFNSYEYEAVIREGMLTDTQLLKMYLYMRGRNDYPIPDIDYVWLAGGQSNMSGRGIVTGTPLVEERMVGAYSFTKAEEFKIGTIPEHSILDRPIATSPDESGSAAPQHGFLLRAAKDVKTNSNKNILYVPCGIGSTGFQDWDTPETLDDRTTLLGAMNYRYHKASSKGGSPVIIWSGHEANTGQAVPDFTNGGVGTTYQTNLTSLFNTVRNNIVDAPIIFVQLASDDTLSVAEAHAAAGEAQRQVELSLENAYMVVAHDVERNTSPDDIHVSRAGMDTIADRVALAFREHILGEAVNGTGPRYQSVSFLGDQVTITFDKAVNTTAGDYDDLFRVYVNGVEQTVTSANRGTNTSTVVLTCSSFLTSPLVFSYGYRAGAASAARTDFVADSDGLPAPLMGPILDPTLLGSELVASQQTTVVNTTGGATIVHDGPNRSVEVTGAGTSNSFPRLRLDLGLTVGRTYRIAGTITGNPSNVSTAIPMRLAQSGTANNVPYDSSTGRFGGDVVAATSFFEVLVNGQLLGTVTIGSITCREVL